MDKKGKMPKIKPSLIIIIIFLVVIILLNAGLGLYYVYSAVNTAKKINDSLGEIKSTLDSVNDLIVQFKEFPKIIEGINNRISNIENRLNQIEVNSNDLKLSEEELKKSLEDLKNIKQELSDIQNNLKNLLKAYPPVQTQNIIFENATDQDITNIITNTIKNRSISLSISFVLGSLFGGLIGFSLYKFVINLRKPKNESDKRGATYGSQ